MDIICAISTPAGVGGIAVVRLSGNGAKELAEGYLCSEKLKAKGEKLKAKGETLRHRHATFCQLRDGDCMIDEVVATYYAAPHSYTGEDVVEISCHGSLYVQQRVLQLFINAGARLAEPGEFTQRAFLNGRLDLSQAEAVADLIDSRSESAHRLAVSQMRGGYAKELEALRQQLIDTAALLELELDFSDEDLEFVSRDRVSAMVAELKTRVERLVSSFQTGNAIKHGIPVAIVGRPNVGKSTLLNALLGEERAIVSDIPGTTRDTIEETVVIDGFTFRFIDTAGMRQSSDTIEMLGIERSIKAVQSASLVLCVVDNNDAGTQVDEVAKYVGNGSQSLIVALNKVDLNDSAMESCQGQNDDALSKEGTVGTGGGIQGTVGTGGDIRNVSISAKTGFGIDTLKRLMVDAVRSRIGEQGDVLLTNARHYEALCHVVSALDEVRKGLEVSLTPDLLVIDLRDALYHLGTITGKVSSDEVLSSIFSRFCIGK